MRYRHAKSISRCHPNIRGYGLIDWLKRNIAPRLPNIGAYFTGVGRRIGQQMISAGTNAVGKVISKYAEGKPTGQVLRQTFQQTVRENARPLLNQFIPR